jgi:hypothetical protein
MPRDDAAPNPNSMGSPTFTLVGPDGEPYQSTSRGTVGGHRRSRIYGRLDCPAALRAVANGGYVAHRVFFADEPTAIAAGYRPCAVCRPDEFRAWKMNQMSQAESHEND